MPLRRAATIVIAFALVASAVAGGEAMSLTLTSESFEAGGSIPRRLTCEGEELSPQLAWSGAPEGTASFVLIVDDPDAPDPAAPRTTWVHWILYDVPDSVSELPEGADAGELPPGTRVGRNGWNRVGYGAFCPPIGRHRYFHKLYALDTRLGDLGEATKGEVLRAMEGHVLAEAELVGTYEKGR